jgi:hypothetical protein
MRNTFRIFALFSLVLFLSTGRAQAGEQNPLLTLVYTANSLGEFRECPVCGAAAQGGLGRRATVFKEMKAAGGDRTLFVAGPYEFAPMVVRKPESSDLARVLAQAYDFLGYDLGVTTPQETEWLASAGAKLPGVFRPLGKEMQTVVLDRAGLKVALVLFPAADLAKETDRGQGLFAAARAAAAKARPGADLVVGVSPWGEAAEMALSESAPGAFDILLGAGKALGYGVRPLAGGRTILVRPPFDGRGLVRFDLLALPAGSDRVWIDGKAYRAEVRMFDWSIPQAPEVVNFFSWL